MAKQPKEKQDRYIRLHHYLPKTSAWLGLSAGARAVYVQVAFRYNGSNNGRIAYSVRDAAAECRLNKNTVSRTFKELTDGGFIEETRHGALSRKTRVASEWRLTEYRCDLTGSLPSKLFMTRGALANANRQPRSRPQKNRAGDARLSQTRVQPVPNEGHECPKRGYSLSQNRAQQTPNCPKRGYRKPDFEPSPVPNEGTHIIYQVYRHLNGSADTTLDGPATTPPTTHRRPRDPTQKKSAREPRRASGDPTVGMPPSHGANEPRSQGDEGEARPPHVTAATAQPKLTWRTPVVRELIGAEAVMRRAEIALEQQQ